MTRRTGKEGLHERVVEDKRERQLERLTWREVAEALEAAEVAVGAVPDPSLQELVLRSRLKNMAWRARREASADEVGNLPGVSLDEDRVGRGFPGEGEG
jgi:hypothetical protein